MKILMLMPLSPCQFVRLSVCFFHNSTTPHTPLSFLHSADPSFSSSPLSLFLLLSLHAYPPPLYSQLTLDDFSLFRQIEATEYVDDLFELKSRYGTPGLRQFAELVNREMFWVITAVCGEHNLVKRMKIVKQFIKVARE